MAVSRDANASAPFEDSAVTIHEFSNMTVGGSGDALVAMFLTGTAAGGITTAAWDPGATNQTLSLITSLALGSGRELYLYGLLAPTTGSKLLRFVTTNSVQSITNSTSYTGVNQTSIAAAFPNAVTNTGTGILVSLTITSASGNMTVDFFTAPVGAAVPTQTQLFFLSGAGSVDGGASEAAGSASNTHQWAIASAAWGVVGCDIAAAGGAAATLLDRRAIGRAVQRGVWR